MATDCIWEANGQRSCSRTVRVLVTKGVIVPSGMTGLGGKLINLLVSNVRGTFKEIFVCRPKEARSLKSWDFTRHSGAACKQRGMEVGSRVGTGWEGRGEGLGSLGLYSSLVKKEEARVEA